MTRALRVESARVAGLVRGCADLGTPVPGLDWTVGQLAAHLASVYNGFGATMRGERRENTVYETRDPRETGAGGAVVTRVAAVSRSLPETVAAVNAAMVGRFTVDQPGVAADALEAGVTSLIKALGAAPDLTAQCPTPWYGPGMTRTVGTLAALAVSETLVHGRDLARALHTDPRLPRESAAAAAATVLSAMLPLLVDPARAGDLDASFELRIRGGERFILRIRNGTAQSEPAGTARVDCVVALDPRAALLLCLGRQSAGRAALNGAATAFGRRPWLGLRLRGLFVAP